MNSIASEFCPVGKTLSTVGQCAKEKSATYTIYTSSTILDVHKDWKELSGERFPKEFEQYLTFERCSPPTISYRYAVVHDGLSTLLSACFQVIRITPENLESRKQNKFISLATKTMLTLHELKVLVCGNVFREDFASVHYTPTLSTAQANELLEEVVQTLQKEEHFSAVMLKDMPQGVGFREEDKAIKLTDDISMALSLDPRWASLKDYIGSLSKKYVARAKKVLEAGASLEKRIFTLKDIESYQKELHFLYKQVLDKQDFRFGCLRETYFAEMKKALGEDFTVAGLFLEQKLVAFYTTISSEDELEIHYIGLDYSLNQSLNLYFNISFLVLDEAIKQKKKVLNMGRTALEAKAILGCKPIYNNTSIKFQCFLSEFAFNYFKRDLSESTSWQTRNPLKETTLNQATQEV